MAYQARVIPVMIASPGDVDEERGMIREILHEWNDINSATARIVLLPVGWETNSSPELGTRPQELINQRLLKHCDLLVGVFWTRLGTPTGKAPSGTVEEIQEHVMAGKPAMIYFSSKPVAPESIDVKQYEQVKAMKEMFRAQGLIETYDSLEDFRSKFYRQLQNCISQNEYLKLETEEAAISPEVTVAERELADQLTISMAAKEILCAAAEKKDGVIFKLPQMGGVLISAGGKGFGGGGGKETAKWEAAIDELEYEGLVKQTGYKGEVFKLTYKGWQVAESIA